MYAITSYPFVNRTLATFRIAEFGFLGVRVITCKQTPRRNGAFSRAGDLLLYFNLFRPLRTSWLIVGIATFFLYFIGLFWPLPLLPRPSGETERELYHRKWLLQQLFRKKLSPGSVPSSDPLPLSEFLIYERGSTLDFRVRQEPTLTQNMPGASPRAIAYGTMFAPPKCEGSLSPKCGG
jgi:hypothetical protein